MNAATVWAVMLMFTMEIRTELVYVMVMRQAAIITLIMMGMGMEVYLMGIYAQQILMGFRLPLPMVLF